MLTDNKCKIFHSAKTRCHGVTKADWNRTSYMHQMSLFTVSTPFSFRSVKTVNHLNKGTPKQEIYIISDQFWLKKIPWDRDRIKTAVLGVEMTSKRSGVTTKQYSRNTTLLKILLCATRCGRLTPDLGCKEHYTWYTFELYSCEDQTA